MAPKVFTDILGLESTVTRVGLPADHWHGARFEYHNLQLGIDGFLILAWNTMPLERQVETSCQFFSTISQKMSPWHGWFEVHRCPQPHIVAIFSYDGTRSHSGMRHTLWNPRDVGIIEGIDYRMRKIECTKTGTFEHVGGVWKELFPCLAIEDMQTCD